MHILSLHAHAYLCNVMAPLWEMPVLEGKILKRRGGPFYPDLQSDLDRMVGLGILLITDVAHIQDATGKWRLEGRYASNVHLAPEPVEFLKTQPEEQRFAQFAREVAFALSALGNQDLERALIEDATYSDPQIGYNNVVDFHEWDSRNLSVNAAQYFDTLARGNTRVTPGEKLHLYVRHLGRRLHAG